MQILRKITIEKNNLFYSKTINIVSIDSIFDLTLARLIFVELTFVKRFAFVVRKYVFLKTSGQMVKITGVDQENLKLIILSLKYKPLLFLAVTFSGLNSAQFKNKCKTLQKFFIRNAKFLFIDIVLS